VTPELLVGIGGADTGDPGIAASVSCGSLTTDPGHTPLDSRMDDETAGRMAGVIAGVARPMICPPGVAGTLELSVDMERNRLLGDAVEVSIAMDKGAPWRCIPVGDWTGEPDTRFSATFCAAA
jgi:hypothetical protein